MNVLLIVVILILIISIVVGYNRGFVRILFSFISFILIIMLAAWLGPYITDFLKENTKIYDSIQESCTEEVKNKIAKKESAGTLSAETRLPKVVQNEIFESASTTMDSILNEFEVYQYLGSYIAEWILKGIVFFITFILANIILHFIINILDVFTKLPVINGINHLLGMAVGLIQGLLRVWLLFFLIMLCCTTPFGEQMISYIGESYWLELLYNYNGIVFLLKYFL